MTIPAGKLSGKHDSKGSPPPFLVVKGKKNGNNIVSKIIQNKNRTGNKNAYMANTLVAFSPFLL